MSLGSTSCQSPKTLWPRLDVTASPSNSWSRRSKSLSCSSNCWRHHIELQLKDLLRLLQELLGEAVTSKRGHNVLGLWQEVEPRLIAAYPEEPHVDDDNIG